MPEPSDTERVAFAFSGGLDTTVCVPLLEGEYGYDEVIGVSCSGASSRSFIVDP